MLYEVITDETRLATIIESAIDADLWVLDLVRGTRSRLTFSGTPTDLTWSPDGSRIVS